MLDRFEDAAGRELIRLGHPVVDAYLELVAARARLNTLLAQAYDLKVFFTVVGVDPVDVVGADVLAFITAQRRPRVAGNVVRIEDGESGLSARTIKRRLATVAGLYDYLVGVCRKLRVSLSGDGEWGDRSRIRRPRW